jgi:hypothetical protein
MAQDATVSGLKAGASKEIKSIEKDGWHKGGTFIFNINQGTLSNWAPGGEQNTLGINTVLLYNVNYRKGKNTWDNNIELALGFQNATSYSRFRKTDDRIDLTTKYGRQLTKKWYAGLLVNFNTQSIAGYEYDAKSANPLRPKFDSLISSFLSPGKLIVSPGFDFKPNKDFSLFFSPVTARWVFKTEKAFLYLDKFGVKSGDKSNFEFGAFLTAKYNKSITKWATYNGRLDLFSNYRHNPQNVDVYFTNLLSMKFNSWLGSNLSLDIVYDDDVIKKTQMKEILGLGLTFKL